MKIIWEIQQGSEQWLRLRAGRVTASAFSRVLTPTGKLSSQQHDYAVELVAECFRPDEIDPENAMQRSFMGNRHTDRGHELEPEARELFANLFPNLEVRTPAFCVREDEIVGCSPDGLVYDSSGKLIAGLEIKCPTPTNHALTLLEDKMPDKYRPQVHGSMAVTGLRYWYFLSYCPGLAPFITRVDADTYTAKIGQELDKFLIYYADVRSRLVPILKGQRPAA